MDPFEILLLAPVEEAPGILAAANILQYDCLSGGELESYDFGDLNARADFMIEGLDGVEYSEAYFDESVSEQSEGDAVSDAAEAYVAGKALNREDLGPPPWLIGFSRQFLKDTSGLDRKLMGRILEVLEELSAYSLPLAPHGDTFKPLKGELRDCWRYRLGDHRLVVRPDPRRRAMDALTIAARGSVYD